MKIRDIKNKELRKLAESYLMDDDSIFYQTGKLIDGFDWVETPQGYSFWCKVDMGIITELPKDIKTELTLEEVNNLIAKECDEFKNELIQKNIDYNNSLHRPNIFKQNPIEGIKARISDKLNRILSKGLDDKTEDSFKDLFGYYIHRKIMLDAANK